MKEKLQEIYDGLKERLKSPFILTFIIVWSIRHWQLLFHLCTFDADAKQSDKYKYMESYLSSQSQYDLFWWPVFYTCCSFVGYLIAALIFESITEIYDRWGRTAILYAFNRNKTVKREELEEVKLKLRETEKSYNELDKMYSDLETETQELEAELDDEIKNHNQLKNSSNELAAQLAEVKSKVKTDDDFVYNRTRKSLYELLLYFTIPEMRNAKSIEIKVPQLFYGVWNRREYTDISLSNSTQHEITFRNESGYGIHDDYLFTVLNLVHHKPGEIYYMTYKTANDIEVSELLFKVSKELVIGGITDNGKKFIKLVEYTKVK